jgi:ubiquinone/menaquinone biosynthesis C-methylase UbiE
MPSPNYDNAAWFYDRLSKLMYGNALIDAQVYLLPHIPANSSILIAGGGTGWILEEIAHVHPSGLKITYVEVSEKMMVKSKIKSVGNNQVIYINKAVEDADLSNSYDVVITAFLFDNFKGETLQSVFDKIDHCLKADGLWLNTDFQLSGKWWQSLMLKCMLLFFRIICNVEASTLPNIKALFKDYQMIDGRTFFGEFISSTAYLKPNKV